MKFGISTACFYPELTETSLQMLVQNNIQNAEIFINSFSELEQPFINKTKKILAHGNTNVISIHPFTSGMEFMFFFSNYNRRFNDGIELYKKYFNFCNEIGASYLVFHGAHKEISMDNQLYFERFSYLNDVALSMGVEVLQENVARCKSNNPEFIIQMKKELGDSVNFVLDTKQCIRSGIAPMEMLKAMGDNLSHVHISDSDKEYDCLPPGKGDGTINSLILSLLDRNYSGSIIIEIYRQNYRDFFELFDSYKWLNNEFIKKLTK